MDGWTGSEIRRSGLRLGDAVQRRGFSDAIEFLHNKSTLLLNGSKMAGNDKSNTQTTEITPLATSEDIQDVWEFFPWKEFSGYVRSTSVASSVAVQNTTAVIRYGDRYSIRF